MKKAIKILIPVIMVIGIAILIIINTTNKNIPANDPLALGNTAGNLMNSGKMCESDGQIFFANPYDSDHLYSMNSDCTDIKKISDDQASYINAAGDYIYYIRNNASKNDVTMIFSEKLFGVIRCKKNGKNVTELYRGQSSDLALCGDTLIYDKLVKNDVQTNLINTDGKNDRVILNEDIDNCSFLGDNISYSAAQTTHYIMNYNINSNSTALLYEGNTFKSTRIGSLVYFIDLNRNYALTEYNMSTRQIRVLTTDKCINYNIYGNTIFYQAENSESEHALKRMTTDGQNNETIIEGDISSIYCTSSYTFFQKFGENTLYRTPTTGKTDIQPFIIKN